MYFPAPTFIHADIDMSDESTAVSGPVDDVARFSAQIGKVAEQLSGLAGSAADPIAYAKRVVARLCPVVLPYDLDTAATFDFTGFNGRGLADDVMDVMLTLATNTALGDGVGPDKSRKRDVFPYFGEPYSNADRTDVGHIQTSKREW